MMKKWLVLLLVFFLLESFGTQGISPAETPQQNQFYVANTEKDCVGYTNCFFNDSTDLPESNALAKAVKFARDNTLTDATINILSPYEINSHFIQVDYPVTIIGKNDGWISSSTSDCSRPMFVISAQATIRDISLNDGACNSPSRDLLVVNSQSPVVIEHSTFKNGRTAISYQAGAGDLIVQFNHLNNNQVAINSTNTDLDANLLVVANNITSSSTSVGSIYAGQKTTCRTASKTIEVIVDNDGRPDLLNDLFFTPFVIGYEQAGVLSFTASATTNSINLNWTTVTEVNTLNFYITRSTTSDGTYEKISGDIAATGSLSSGSSYSFSDSTAVAGQTYYYKLVVINSDGSVQQTVGPLSASIAPLPAATNTCTPTRTLTPTRTITPTRTLTPFRTATSAFKTPLPDEPTLFLPTFTDTPTIEITPDLSLTPAETPTPTSTPSRTPTPTVSGTPKSGLLEKTDRYSGQKQVPFYLGGVAVLILIVLLAVYIHRKH